MIKKRERSYLVFNLKEVFRQIICRITASLFCIAISFSLLFPSFVNLSYRINKNLTSVKTHSTAEKSIWIVVTEAEPNQVEEDNEVKYNNANLFNFEYAHVAFCNNLTKRFIQLNNDLNRRPKAQYFILYHSWKFDLS